MEEYRLPQASVKNTLKWIVAGKLSLPQILVCQGSEEERFCAYSRMVGNSSLISDLVDDVESVCLSIFKKGVRLNV
jgi:hypothetical protein